MPTGMDARLRRLLQGQEDPEGRRPARSVDDVEEAFVGLGDRFGDGQPGATPRYAGFGRRSQTVEAFEELRTFGLWDPRAFVEHLDPGEGIRRVDDDLHPPPSG